MSRSSLLWCALLLAAGAAVGVALIRLFGSAHQGQTPDRPTHETQVAAKTRVADSANETAGGETPHAEEVVPPTRSAAHIEGEDGRSVEDLLHDLDNPDPAVQLSAASNLPHGLSAEAVAVLARHLESAPSDYLWYALIDKIAYSSAPRSVVFPILRGVSDKLVAEDREDYQNLLRAFDAKNPEELEFLDRLYRTAPQAARWYALKAMIEQSGDCTVFEHVQAVCRSGEEGTRRSIATGLNSVTTGTNVQEILDFLGELGRSDPSPTVRRAAQESVRRMEAELQARALMRRVHR